MDYDSAVNALVSATDADAAATAPAVPAETSKPVAADPVDAGATTPDSFTNVDIASLPADLQQVYKSMQADYTRKTQEVADYRKLADQYGGLDTVQEGLEFLKAVQSDPDVALAFHGQLTDALTQAGLTPGEAAAAATEAMQGAGTEELDDPRDQTIQELLSWKQEVQQQEHVRQLEAQLTRQEMAIRQSNPDYTDEDIGDIYSLSYSTNGDLLKAAEAYTGLRSRLVGGFVNGKGSVPAGVSSPSTSAGSSQVPPEGFGSNLDAAHEAAMREFSARMALEG